MGKISIKDTESRLKFMDISGRNIKVTEREFVCENKSKLRLLKKTASHGTIFFDTPCAEEIESKNIVPLLVPLS